MKVEESGELVQKRFSIRIVPVDPPDDLASDKSKKPAKLTSERAKQLAQLIYQSYKQWNGL